MRTVKVLVLGLLVTGGAVRAQPRAGAARPILHARRAQGASRRAASPRCPEGMVLIPAGSFWMGSRDADDRPDEALPLHRVTLSAFCVDRTEARVRDYRACASAGRCEVPDTSLDWPDATPAARESYNRFCNLRADAEAREGREDHPMNCIDWGMANDYCAWRGGRLPTEAEWEYAASGTDGRVYPWGNAPPSVQRLNACDLECLELLHTMRLHWSLGIDGADGHPDTAPVGSYPAGASPFGLLDMAGNVWEWTADWWSEPYRMGPQVNPTGPFTGTHRVIRGGSWYTEDPDNLSAQAREGIPPSMHLNRVGVRCVASPR